jgi:methylated-DNA-[protein]-cysteine S-methyltransferase
MRVTRHAYDVAGWGRGELWLAGGRVVEHDLPAPTRVPSRNPAETVPEASRWIVERVTAYLAGERVMFADVPLDLDWCTPFQRAAAEALRAVPWGEVVTYGELAALAGRPGAQRAAGAFCAGNRLALFLPCHRVVAAGGIGGYGTSGVELKRRLLRLEHVAL